jgi:hypothetical protein
MKRLLLLMAGLAVILAGVVSFAAFESHIVKIRAHVESATYTTPYEIDFKTVFPQEVVYKWCGPLPEGVDAMLGETECVGGDCGGQCAKIWLSHSFLTQNRVKDVEYEIFCEFDPGPCKAGDTECIGGPPPEPITPYIVLSDSDKDMWPGDIDQVRVPGNCVIAAGDPPVSWARGSLHKVADPVDWWDLTFYVPACADNYNPDTDPGQTPPGIPGVIDTCYKGPDPDSYRWVNLAGDIKFQVTGFSYGCVCRDGDAECTCE